MNKDEFEGGTRYAVGKVEKAVGDVSGSRDWKVDGVVDQVAGGAQHTFGRAREIVADAIDSAPDLAAEARDRLKAAGTRVADGAERGGRATVRTVEDNPLIWALAAAVGGYALAWLIHGRDA